MTFAARTIVALGLAVFAVACERTYIEGRANNMRGEALPGVSVRVAGAAAQDLTDGLGHYRIAAPPGAVSLVFSKTGYTSTQLSLEAKRRGPAPDATLWMLPMNPGVYMVTGEGYHETSFVVPKQHYLKDKSVAYGVELPADVFEATTDPFIITHRVPRYNARLSRLVAEEAKLEGIEEKSIEVWVERGTSEVSLEPIDPAGNLLQRVRIGRTLDPGFVYGLHWGAMEGYTTLDNRVFLFRVPESPDTGEEAAVEAVEPGAEPAEAATAEDAPKKKEEAPSAEEAVPPASKPELPAQDILEPTDDTPAPTP